MAGRLTHHSILQTLVRQGPYAARHVHLAVLTRTSDPCGFPFGQSLGFRALMMVPYSSLGMDFADMGR